MTVLSQTPAGKNLESAHVEVVVAIATGVIHGVDVFVEVGMCGVFALNKVCRDGQRGRDGGQD